MITEPRSFLRYSPNVEEIGPGEAETADAITDAMRSIMQKNIERYGHAVQPSHGKSHGAVTGELTVLDGLAEPYRQGLFAEPRSYPVIVRLAHVPGEILEDDKGPSTPRGMSIKVLGVDGPKIDGHQGESTQDFVLDTGKVFPASNAKVFLGTIKALDMGTDAPEGVKKAVSVASRGTNALLHGLGIDSANMDFFGHEPLHPLAESYFSQAPLRYGDYIAKLGVYPVNEPLRSLVGERIRLGDDKDALRHCVIDYFSRNDAEYEVRIQLCTDLDRMPVEDAHKAWDEDASPYVAVARLRLPAQAAYTETRRAYVDDALSFSPGHSLEAHRPLGSIMRARLRAYPAISSERRRSNGDAVREPAGAAEAPA